MMHPTTPKRGTSKSKTKSKARGLYSLIPGVGRNDRIEEEEEILFEEDDEGDIGTATTLQVLEPSDYKVVDGQGGEAGDEIILPYEYEVAREKALVRRLDRRLMPCLFAMIVLNYLDRNALANARVQGIEKDLGLTGSNFSTAISIFFVGYVGLQVPSNLLITRVRPSLYLPGCMIAWGILSGFTAFTTSFFSLTLLRFLLGFVEAPFFPGALYLLSTWYTKRELALRTSILYSGSLLSGAFGGLIGASVEATFGNFLGISSWRWLFLLESSCTILLAVSAMFILPDYPHSTRWMSAEDRNLAIARVRSQPGYHASSQRQGSLLNGLKLAVKDYKVWLLSLIIITKTSAGAVTSFIPTLLATFGFGRITTLLMVAPPYVIAAAVSLFVGRMSDAKSQRGSMVIATMTIAAIGFAAAAIVVGEVWRYLCLFVMLGGVYGGYNVALAWISSTLPSPPEKRSAAIAIINTMGNVAQIYSPYLYLPQNGPRYLGAMIVNTVFCLMCVGIAGFLRRCLYRENLLLERIEYVGEEEEAEPGFRYVL